MGWGHARALGKGEACQKTREPMRNMRATPIGVGGPAEAGPSPPCIRNGDLPLRLHQTRLPRARSHPWLVTVEYSPREGSGDPAQQPWRDGDVVRDDRKPGELRRTSIKSFFLAGLGGGMFSILGWTIALATFIVLFVNLPAACYAAQAGILSFLGTNF